MVKYCGHYTTCQEVPNEVSLTFSITNCPHRCEGCHSPWLQENIGDELTLADILYYMNKYSDGFTCVCFMGTGGDLVSLKNLVEYVRSLGYKTCVYSGESIDAAKEVGFPDYFKEGQYNKELGGLNHRTTNQHMWKKNSEDEYEDITEWFWRKKE